MNCCVHAIQMHQTKGTFGTFSVWYRCDIQNIDVADRPCIVASTNLLEKCGINIPSFPPHSVWSIRHAIGNSKNHCNRQHKRPLFLSSIRDLQGGEGKIRGGYVIVSSWKFLNRC